MQSLDNFVLIPRVLLYVERMKVLAIEKSKLLASNPIESIETLREDQNVQSKVSTPNNLANKWEDKWPSAKDQRQSE